MQNIQCKLLILFTVLLLLILLSLMSDDDKISNTPVAAGQIGESHLDYKYILTWCHAYNDPSYGLIQGFDGFKNCKQTKCYLTSDRNHLGKGNYQDFDAILFHQRSFSLQDAPNSSMRQPLQRYVHWSLESPLYSYHDLTNLKYLPNYFNWSMSYRMDADFPVPYGKLKQIRKHPKGGDLEKLILDFGKRNQNLYLKSLKNSTKSVAAWMVSNCKNLSRRDLFTQRLKRLNFKITFTCTY